MAVFIILTPGFPADESDTSCLPAPQQFVLSLKTLYPEHEFIVLSFQYPFVKKTYTWHGIRVIAAGGSNKPGLQRFITWLHAWKTLRQLHREKPAAGLISLWLTECALVGKLFSKRQHIPHYTWMQGQDAKKSNQYVRRIRPDAERLIAISDFNRDDFYRNHGKMPFMVAENGITPAFFPPLNEGTRNIDVLGVGSLIALKNYRLFIGILAELKKTKPGLKAVLAGTGVDEESLRAYAMQLGLQGTLHFTGPVSHPEVLHLMNDSRTFLHTSDYEGNSTVLIEALYSGCSVFSTCPLSTAGTEGLKQLSSKEEFVVEIRKQFEDTGWQPKRITFNTMARSAAKIMGLFLNKA